jgi:hypothetical protein
VLGTTLWLVVAIGLVATVLADGAAAYGRAGLHAAADHAIDAAMHDAVADYQNQLQAALEHDAPSTAGGTSSNAGSAAPGTDNPYAGAIATLPNPLERSYPAATNDVGGGAGFMLAYDVTPTTLRAPSCASATPDASGSDTIAWLQCNGFIAESRMSLRVVVRVLDAAGNATLARREQYVTLRLFGEPPYSAVVGRKDASAADPASADALASPAHEGDVAGDTISGASPAPLASSDPAVLASPWPAGGTLIHVRYECHDGAGSCANAAPPDPDTGLRAGARWSNGNRPSP